MSEIAPRPGGRKRGAPIAGHKADRSYPVLRPGQGVRSANVVALLRYLLANGPSSRSEIALGLGLTQGSVTRITAQAEEIGLVSTLAPQPTARGRPRVPIAVAQSAGLIASIHVGVVEFVARLVTVTGERVAEIVMENESIREGTAQKRLVQLAKQLWGSTSEPILAMTVISGGWVEPASGVIRRFEPLGWRDVPVRDLLAAELDVPIFVESTVRAHAIADLTYGRAAAADFVHVFVGNIVEMASVVDGRVVQRDDGFGGDLSRWTVEDAEGQARPASDVLSDLAMVRIAKAENLLPEHATFDQLLEHAQGENDDAARLRRILADRSRAAGRLIGQLSLTLAPKMIFVSSGVASVPDVAEPLGEEVKRLFGDLPAPEVHVDARGRYSVARAAAAVGVERTILDRDFVSGRITDVLSEPATDRASDGRW